MPFISKVLYRVGQKKCVLGCVIPPAGAVARSGNLGQTFLANSVHTVKGIFLSMRLRGTHAGNQREQGGEIQAASSLYTTEKIP